jgi:hypothetical protein
VAQAPGQGTAVLGGRRVLLDQLFLAGERPVVAIAGLGRPAQRSDHVVEVVVRCGDAGAVAGDFGVVIGQLLVEH